MKRYQCIKNVIDVNYRGHSYISFSAGSIYEMDDDGNMRDNDRFTAIFLPSELKEHFHELLDLNVDEPIASYQDHDAAEYDRYLSGLPSSRGCLIATAITIAFIATLIITWNS